MKKIIIDRWQFSVQEALIFTFTISKDIEEMEWVVSTQWFWSAVVKQNKKSIKLKLYRPLTERKDYITEIIEKIVNTFYNYKIK